MPSSILVIEDDPDIGNMVMWTLTAEGHSATLVTSRDDALHQLDASPFDTILMDYSMPGMAADEFSELVRVHWPATRLIVITAADKSAILARKISADGYIDKPFDPTSLTQKIKNLSAGARGQAPY